MRKLWWAALCAAVIMFADHANAALVQISAGGETYYGVGPEGPYHAPDDLGLVETFYNWSASVVFDTDNGSFDALGDSFTGNITSVTLNLGDAGSFTAHTGSVSADKSFDFYISGAGFSAGGFILDAPDVPLFTPLYLNGDDPLGGVSFGSYSGYGFTEYIRVDVQPSPAPAPELATWTLMVLGFGAAGSALRRHRKLPLA